MPISKQGRDDEPASFILLLGRSRGDYRLHGLLFILRTVEKPLAFAPRGRVALTPSGEIVLTLLGEIKMTPEKQTFFRGFFIVLRYLPWPVVNNPKL